MTDSKPNDSEVDSSEARDRSTLPPAARRALEEAEERRRRAQADEPAREIGGRGGADPARFGDWEIAGRAIDF